MTSDQFFEVYPQKKYDVIFIDGLHLENQVDRDIFNALKHLNPGGVVIVHDCLPTTPQSQSEENPTGDWVGTVWRSIVKYTLYSYSNISGKFCNISRSPCFFHCDTLHGMVHILDEDPVTFCRIVDKNVGYRADQLAILQDRASAHALYDSAGFGK